MSKYNIEMFLLFEDFQEWEIRNAYDEMLSEMGTTEQKSYMCPIHHLRYKPSENGLYCPADICPFHRHTVDTEILRYLR